MEPYPVPVNTAGFVSTGLADLEKFTTEFPDVDSKIIMI